VSAVRLGSGEPITTAPGKRKLIATAAIIALCAFAAELRWLGVRPDPEVEIHALAVLPFDDLSPGRDLDYFCQGLAEELTEAVTRIPGLQVIARSSASNFKRTSSIERAETRLGVQAVLDGSVRREADRMRITAELLRTRDGVRIWSETYDAGTDNLFAVQASIARSVGEKLRRRVGERPYTPARYTSDLVLYNLYLKGRAGSPSLCQEAIERNPQYAPAHSCLADAYAGMWTAGLDPRGALARARTAAETALRLDNRLPEAHLTQAQILAGYWDWSGALQETERAIRLAPNFGPALWHRANLLLFTGREQEAGLAYTTAEALDPMSPGVLSQKLQILFNMRRYDETIALAEQHPAEQASLYYSARAYAEKGRLAEAIRFYEEYRRDDPRTRCTALEHSRDCMPRSAGGTKLSGFWKR
jgi:serine/threonine-protein kinase